ncbi:hypothetical protein GTU73_04850 [Rathayibacter sp. VKM Ac-2804]|uniref:hypothetical protein n=1 Tax=unclassified Rathayibacter TaxID=2609250 RepID=UPI00132F142B|nr:MULTISPECIES: hypothetical protein [unclassified Rathayibacter]NRG40417.1 hypothetical protein [Rathayibacter sp. VKM Ac-2835]QHF23401.1 hypothetical protein GTU73_04850 [Rathayibacter sp. VKM Ac-2804]
MSTDDGAAGRTEDPALADELASIRAVGEGRRGDAADESDVEHGDPQTVEQVEQELKGGLDLD